MARPTDYSDEMLAKAREYLSACKDGVEVEAGPGDKPAFRRVVKVPTKGGLARHLGISRDTLYKWSEAHDGFSDIMEEVGSEQEDRLINNGLAGTYNPTIAKVLLTKHGYRDAVDTDLTSKGGSVQPILVQFIDEKADTDTEGVR